ncbi:hypothetical protein FRB93_004791 [Tulasnella sp. JGI-2019a]|nr:hypothetical protein FRB93_004791 [Tulasnella sp. JGI-2019a]
MCQMIAHGLGIAGGVGGAYFTFGMSLIGAIFSGRSLYVAARKYAILMEEWRDRGFGHQNIVLRKRDVAAACVAGIAIGLAAVVPMFPLAVGGQIIAYIGLRAVAWGIELRWG